MIATEYCKKVFDGTHDSPKPVENGRLLITSKHIANRSLDISSAYLISEEDFENVNKRSQVHQWDILFSMIGTVGNVYIETSEKIDYAIKNMGVFSCQNKGKAYWLYYYLQSPLVQAKIDALMAGAVQKFVPLGFLRDLDIPEYTENSKKVVQVLSALDDKIALNKKMNQKLEAMAKRLYDYWFVQFDFPDKNGHPYKTTGGPMTYNPTLKREIPEGWEVSNICPLMEILPGGTPSKAKPEYWNGDIPFFGPTDYCGDVFQLSTEEYITEKGLNNCASALYPPKTIFITARGSVGKLIVCGKPMAMNQSCYALKPFDLEKYEYLFYLTKQLIEQLKKKGSGSVFKSINTLDIEQSFLSIAPNEIIDLYCKKVKSIFDRIKSNTIEIAKLTTLRDKLLPLLMNGQVIVA